MSVRVQQVQSGEFADFNKVLSLLQRAFAYMDERIAPPSSLKQLDVAKIKLKAQQETLFLLTVNDEIAGCVFAKLNDGHVYLGKLAVDSRFRGRGYARRLMSRVEQHAQDNGIDYVELETRVELTENQHFFTSAGYVKIAENAHRGYDRPTSYRYRKNVR
jgi:ribosomal protein S18 acetylase RimI-like enzyme